MIYSVEGYLTPLSGTQMAAARPLTFTPHSAAGLNWDNQAMVVGADNHALLHSVYSFEAKEGATYDVFSTSFFDPYLLRIHDNSGNTVVANDEADDLSYGTDLIYHWRAPYSGTFYVDASWNQGSYYTSYSLSVYEDVGTAISPSAPGRHILGSNLPTFSDTIIGTSFGDTILGLEGSDSITGGGGTDDLNGNQGADIVRGGDGADTVRGGQGNDGVYGDAGDDGHVNGNLGDDFVFGGTGNDTVYGGQGADSLFGEDGNDLLSGDLGNDILTGGAGGDWFVFRAGGGLDWVADFNSAVGDRIVLTPGTAYTVTEVGGQAVINIGGSDQIGLAGVTVAAMGDWLVYA